MRWVEAFVFGPQLLPALAMTLPPNTPPPTPTSSFEDSTALVAREPEHTKTFDLDIRASGDLDTYHSSDYPIYERALDPRADDLSGTMSMFYGDSPLAMLAGWALRGDHPWLGYGIMLFVIPSSVIAVLVGLREVYLRFERQELVHDNQRAKEDYESTELNYKKDNDRYDRDQKALDYVEAAKRWQWALEEHEQEVAKKILDQEDKQFDFDVKTEDYQMKAKGELLKQMNMRNKDAEEKKKKALELIEEGKDEKQPRPKFKKYDEADELIKEVFKIYDKLDEEYDQLVKGVGGTEEADQIRWRQIVSEALPFDYDGPLPFDDDDARKRRRHFNRRRLPRLVQEKSDSCDTEDCYMIWHTTHQRRTEKRSAFNNSSSGNPFDGLIQEVQITPLDHHFTDDGTLQRRSGSGEVQVYYGDDQKPELEECNVEEDDFHSRIFVGLGDDMVGFNLLGLVTPDVLLASWMRDAKKLQTLKKDGEELSEMFNFGLNCWKFHVKVNETESAPKAAAVWIAYTIGKTTDKKYADADAHQLVDYCKSKLKG